MEILGRQISENGVLHLIDNENPRSQTWLTVCGRKIRATHALPLQKFDAGANCCTVCARMQRSNELLRSRLPTVA
ncbi:hypothetical protein [Nostoc sp. 'Peltigera membranacea cyanobiont' N6]|uniref:hypothetical protein n=1 Tax=Nostoc sp. 'Peltigera membranacea cyanobiont' N6 TaxID=1261031 RepID=UPI000CF3243B|nr:hypothetical protein [Nostoc sp. 'Peltigera membranacea cyanobiont' N6]AVH62003.1 hypothetical protein NPM_0117 [Nostoc sp. 'Peltigera membranacea cyanobiont' N6]